MQSFAQHLVEHVLAEKVEFETAATAATNRHDFEIAVQQALRAKQVEDAADEPPESDGNGGGHGAAHPFEAPDIVQAHHEEEPPSSLRLSSP
jgi:hypothetical protein